MLEWEVDYSRSRMSGGELSLYLVIRHVPKSISPLTPDEILDGIRGLSRLWMHEQDKVHTLLQIK